jgi:hypothetical protein
VDLPVDSTSTNLRQDHRDALEKNVYRGQEPSTYGDSAREADNGSSLGAFGRPRWRQK